MSLRLLENASLAGLNTFGVAARARRLVTLEDERDLPQALAALAGGPRLVLGAGSNVLFAGDFDGTILLMRTRGRRVLTGTHDTHDPTLARIALAAGESWDGAVAWALEQGLAGLENLAMIPGTCGAAAIQNIGAYGVELCERFDSLRAVDTDSGEVREFTRQDCRFGYRDSLFKQTQGRHWLILELRLRVGPGHRPVLHYGELASAIAADGGPAGEPAAARIAAAVRAIRSRKLPDPAVLGNAGSFFKNPVVSAEVARNLLAREPAMPAHPVNESATKERRAPSVPDSSTTAARSPAAREADMKLSAGWLIERCGWKGYRQGDAGVHAAHALVLVNHGQASGREIAALAERIRHSVHERYGVWLEPEPSIIGGS